MNRETDIRRLTGLLAAEDGAVREQSRNELIQLGGHDVASSMVTTLSGIARVKFNQARDLCGVE